MNPDFHNTILGYQLRWVSQTILTLAAGGMITTIYLSFLMLPTRPTHFAPIKYIGFLFQWLLVPFVSIGLSSASAIDAQTRLMLGKYLEYQVTEKAVARQ
jgi:hypothetical protein